MEKVKEMLGKAYTTAFDFLTSKHMKAIYWGAFAQLIAGSGDYLVQVLTAWNPDNMITVAIGLGVARITKYLNTTKK